MLFCASNENRVLTDFINTGTYDITDREFMLTPSPSMDILVSSNLERQLFELTGRNAEAIRGWMAQQKAEKRFQVDAETFRKLRADFASDSVDSAECLKTIRAVYEEHGYLLDPHSAVAFKVAERLRGDNPVLVASTAHWAKFGENVYRALHGMAPGEPLPADVAAWLAARKAEGIQLAVASNNHEPRVAPFAQKIGVKWVSDAGKPLPRGFARAQAQFGVPKAQMALIGDQLFTDVLGARLFGIRALLVEPMAPDHKWYIRLKRVLEKPFVTLYYKRGGQRSGE
jgi:threonine synthase